MTDNGHKPGEVILSVDNLQVEFRTGGRVVKAVNGVSFDIESGKTLAILGESGSGKSITFEAVLGILDAPPGVVTGGKAMFDGDDLFQLNRSTRRAISGSKIGMIFQDPLSALNPVYWNLSVSRMHRAALAITHMNFRAACDSGS
jgi:oligopeptide transport system ATP-binding protein